MRLKRQDNGRVRNVSAPQALGAIRLPQESLRSLPPGGFYAILDLKSVLLGFLTQVSVGVPLLKRNNLLAPPALRPLDFSRVVWSVPVRSGGKNVELTLDAKHEDCNANHNCGAIDLVGDVIEDPGDFDQQPGMTAEFLLCTYVRRNRSRLWDMTSLGLHRSTPTCGSFLRSQGGGPANTCRNITPTTCHIEELNLPGCLKVETTVWKLRPSTNSAPIGSSRNQKHRRLQQHQEISQERYSRDDGECREGPEMRIAGPKYEQTINGHCPVRNTPRHRTGYRRTQTCLRRAPTRRRTT